QGAQVMNAGEIAPGNLELPHRGARRHNELIESPLGARLTTRPQAQQAAPRIYTCNFRRELHLNAALAIEVLRIDSYFLFILSSGEEALGKRRPLVWDRTVGGDDR